MAGLDMVQMCLQCDISRKQKYKLAISYPLLHTDSYNKLCNVLKGNQGTCNTAVNYIDYINTAVNYIDYINTAVNYIRLH